MYKYTSMQGVGEVHRVYGVHELCGWMRCMGFMVFVGVCVYMCIYIYIYIYRERERCMKIVQFMDNVPGLHGLHLWMGVPGA